jgi:UDP-D-galactose:(glucosyl)LPS alpha-1,6-D-galactosyltransferase
MSGQGGSESAVVALTEGLQSRGDEVRIYLFGGLPRDPRWLESVPHRVLGNPTEKRWRRLYKYTFGLAGEFRRVRPNIVVALDAERLLTGRIVLALSGVKASLWSWIHFAIEPIKRNRLLSLADGHLAVSEGVAGQIKTLVNPSRRNRVITIYNAVGTDAPLVTRPAKGEVVEFLHIGRLEFAAQKRVADLLAAVARVRGSFRLTIIGDGPDRAELEQYSRELGIGDRIEWLGWKEKPWDHVAKASVLLLTSSYESFGIVLVEALSRGIPCITSNCKYGPDEIVEHDKNGWLYPVGNVDRLTQLMQAVVDDPLILPAQSDVSASARKFSVQAALVLVILPQTMILWYRVGRFLEVNVAKLLGGCVARSVIPLGGSAACGLLVHRLVVIRQHHLLPMLAEAFTFIVVYSLLAYPLVLFDHDRGEIKRYLRGFAIRGRNLQRRMVKEV